MSSIISSSNLQSCRFFDLNIEEILENWNVEHALREIIANALDEQQLTATKEVQIFKENALWHIRDFGRGLKYEHLTQNENAEKQENSNLVIGKFGIGLKDALATFDRKEIHFHIQSKYGDITTQKVTKHGFEKLTTLHAVLSPPSQPNMEGTEFTFDNLKDEDIAKAQNLFLKFSGETIFETTQFGQVIEKKISSNCRIYINGLKVAEEENFLFSYNITSITVEIKRALNRERSNVGRTAYAKRVQAILLACKTTRIAQCLINDVQKLTTGFAHDELRWNNVSTHAIRVLNQAEKKSLFVTSRQLDCKKNIIDEAKRRNEQIILLPENIFNKIDKIKDASGNPIRTLQRYIQERHQSFQFHFISPADLTEEERNIFNYINQIFMLIGGVPHQVKEIVISETMRPGDTVNTLGLWRFEENQIIILRSQLQSLTRYASTLLHEAAHALSGASDISREFESQLTKQLGEVASMALLSNNLNYADIKLPPLKKQKFSPQIIEE